MTLTSMLTRITPLLAFLLLVGCHGNRAATPPAAPTQVIKASYVGSTARMIQVQMESQGSFQSQLSLPLDPDVKVYVGDKRVALGQLGPGQAIKLTRNLKTYRVVRVDAGG